MTIGIEDEKVSRWLAASVEGVTAPFSFDFVSGGRSNLTFTVTDATGRRVVLRRPPVSHVLASAHDMGREYRVISALQPTPVPVPGALGFCEDVEVNGAPFYVMDFVEGHVLRGAAEASAVLDDGARAAAGRNLVNVLADLHDVDVDAVGLGQLGRRGGYVARQLQRWHGQFVKSQEQEEAAGVFRPAQVVDEVHRMLVERTPEEKEVCIAHGDYRLDNTIVGADGSVRAVLDWELCTLGTPLADLATLLVYWADPGDPMAATGLPGFPDRKAVVDMYAERSGRDVTDLAYYVAFAHWRLACIIEGVYVRYATGAMGPDTSGAAGFADGVLHRAELARKVLTAGTIV
ncbi:MAG TPA: phosphotransferase family protein [Acidimicrobiales bacterium]|nr:phosphotransferase family protein [Acidimicrobiales bacterium]